MGIPDEGLVQICGLVGDSGTTAAFKWLATGQGSEAFKIADSALEDEIINTDSLGLKRVAATVTKEDTNITDDTLQLTTTFTVVGTTTIKEVGVVNNATKGHTDEEWLSRTVLPTPKDVVSGSSYTLTYKIIFTRV